MSNLPGDAIVDEELEAKVREEHKEAKARRKFRHERKWNLDFEDWLRCPECQSEDVEEVDTGYYWNEYRCQDCETWVEVHC